MIELRDVVVLGMAVPEQARDGRNTVCMAAYQQDLGLIRIYPCRADMGLNRWQKITVFVEKNPSDTRYESFRMVGSKDQWDSLSVSKTGVVKKEDRVAIVDRLKSACVHDINTARLSLGVIKPYAIHDVWLDDNPTFGKAQQKAIPLNESEQWLKTKSDYPFQPRISYQCSPTCKGHNQTILEWGAFEWMRKNPGQLQQLIDNWRLHDSQYEHYLLVGNQAQHRTGFLVINMLWFKRESCNSPALKQPELFGVAA